VSIILQILPIILKSSRRHNVHEENYTATYCNITDVYL